MRRTPIRYRREQLADAAQLESLERQAPHHRGAPRQAVPLRLQGGHQPNILLTNSYGEFLTGAEPDRRHKSLGQRSREQLRVRAQPVPLRLPCAA